MRLLTITSVVQSCFARSKRLFIIAVALSAIWVMALILMPSAPDASMGKLAVVQSDGDSKRSQLTAASERLPSVRTEAAADERTRLPVEQADNVQMNRKILNVQFRFNILPVDAGGSIMEFDWITNVLLGKINRPIRIADATLRLNDTLVVTLGALKSKDYDQLRRDGFVNQAAYHMGDEGMEHNVGWYKDASYVFRNYFNRKYEQQYSNVMYVPLGVKCGFGSLNPAVMLPASKRKYTTNFIGSIRSNRHEMIKTLKKYNINCYWSYEHSWASPKGMHVISYRNVLRESTFTLAPWGNNPESMRLYEAMEVGSIPVFQTPGERPRSPLNAFGDHPIPQFENWDKAAQFMIDMMKNPHELDALQRKIIAFWTQYKSAVQLKIRQVIDESFHRSHGYQC